MRAPGRTGRRLTPRRRYEADIDKILKACAVTVEINAHPWRLELDWRWHQKVLDHGRIFSINPDAHSIQELDHMHWGVEMHARAAYRLTAFSTPCRSPNCVACSADGKRRAMRPSVRQ